MPDVVEEVLAPVGPPPVPMITQVVAKKDTFFNHFVVPKGVDLNLNQFDLSTTAQVEAESVAGSWAGEGIGKAFWTNIEGDEQAFDDEATGLLQDIFNPNMSDRREEGDHFVPPGASFSYVEKLRSLVKAEMEVRNKRKEHFLSTKFVAGDAGPLFPSSWTDALETARGRQPLKAFGELLPEGACLQQAEAKADIQRVLQMTTPVLERSTEDGMTFRIYKSGSLEVRTVQEHSKQEILGAVFSIRTAAQATSEERRIGEGEKIVKATEYVKFLSQGEAGSELSYYVVMKSDQDNEVVTEKFADGTATWEENPVDLEDRNSLAKVIRAVECRIPRTRVSFQDVRSFQTKEGDAISEGRMYAQRVFIQAVGGVSQMIRSNTVKAKTIEAERVH